MPDIDLLLARLKRDLEKYRVHRGEKSSGYLDLLDIIRIIEFMGKNITDEDIQDIIEDQDSKLSEDARSMLEMHIVNLNTPDEILIEENVEIFNRAVEYWRHYLVQSGPPYKAWDILYGTRDVGVTYVNIDSTIVVYVRRRYDEFIRRIRNQIRFGPIRISATRLAMIFQEKPGDPCWIVYV